MIYVSYAFVALAMGMSVLLGLLSVILLVYGACWLVCWAVYLIGTKAPMAWHRHRVQDVIRTEVTRGLTEIDKFVKAHATGSERPNTDVTREEP